MTHVLHPPRILSTAIVAAALIGATVTHAQPAADTFTFQSKADNTVTVGSNGTGPSPYAGSYIKGTFSTDFADGPTQTGRYTCVAMTQPPTDKLFDLHMLCDGTDGQGSYSVTMGCSIIDAATTNWSCIGGMYGKSGAYEGRRGAITNHSVGGAATGTGQWYR